MGILVSPELSGKITPWQLDSWTSRVMAVELEGLLIANFYALTHDKEQRQFFQDMESWLSRHDSIILGVILIAFYGRHEIE